MAEATAHNEVSADQDPACEPGAIRARAVPVGPTRQGRVSCAVPELVQGHVWLDAVEATHT